MSQRLTTIIQAEDGGYISICPELDIASQGDTEDDARKNLKEAVELFFESASPEEIDHRELRWMLARASGINGWDEPEMAAYDNFPTNAE